MTSRLSAHAALFALLATASLAFAANRQVVVDVPAAPSAAAKVQVVQLERVVVTAKRLQADR